MKRIINIANKFALVALGALAFASCNDFLDEMPDNRTEVDNAENIKLMLVSAYSEALPITIMELMSDDVTDYGKNVSIGYDVYEDAYLMREFTGESTSSPTSVWSSCYGAIAAANHALDGIQKLGDPEELAYLKGEALVCRAYHHFVLVNTFCQAYNPQSSTTDMGIPYVTEPETVVFVDYDRGTVADVYAKIAQDLEEGVKLIDDTQYEKPKYHFTTRAASAFAAQFYLHYGKYDESVKYATMALGDDPAALYRTWDLFLEGNTSAAEYSNAFINSDEPANFFIQGVQSMAGRRYYYRYITTSTMINSLARSAGPWGNSALEGYDLVFQSSSRSYFMPKMMEKFIYTDAVAGIGYPYVVKVVYSVEKTLIDRAEAHVMMKEYDKAAEDLSRFYTEADNGAPHNLSAQEIAAWYEAAFEAGDTRYVQTMAPRFELEEGMQTFMAAACLHARRIAGSHEGDRLMDLKRWGIAYTHVRDGADNIVVEPYDKRLAVQLPKAAVAAGLPANPR